MPFCQNVCIPAGLTQSRQACFLANSVFIMPISAPRLRFGTLIQRGCTLVFDRGVCVGAYNEQRMWSWHDFDPANGNLGNTSGACNLPSQAADLTNNRMIVAGFQDGNGFARALLGTMWHKICNVYRITPSTPYIPSFGKNNTLNSKTLKPETPIP